MNTCRKLEVEELTEKVRRILLCLDRECEVIELCDRKPRSSLRSVEIKYYKKIVRTCLGYAKEFADTSEEAKMSSAIMLAEEFARKSGVNIAEEVMEIRNIARFGRTLCVKFIMHE